MTQPTNHYRLPGSRHGEPKTYRAGTVMRGMNGPLCVAHSYLTATDPIYRQLDGASRAGFYFLDFDCPLRLRFLLGATSRVPSAFVPPLDSIFT